MLDVMVMLLVAAATCFGLHKTDDTNLQIVVLPLALGMLFWLSPEGERGWGGAGIALGTAAYLAYFFVMRVRAAPMPAYPKSTVAQGIAVTAAPRPPARTGPRLATPRGPDGPYYRPGSPEKQNIAHSATDGERMFFVGRVLNGDGVPVEGAIIEIWHADGEGEYDHEEFNCRGHQFTDKDGQFFFDTVKPSGYGTRSLSLVGTVDFRSAHIHVKIRVGNRTVTTQVWFPDDERNRLDVAYWKFKNTNVVSYNKDTEVLASQFDFVI